MLHLGSFFYSNTFVAKSTKNFMLLTQMVFEGELCYLNSNSLYVNGYYIHFFLIPESEYAIHSTVTVSANVYWRLMGNM